MVIQDEGAYHCSPAIFPRGPFSQPLLPPAALVFQVNSTPWSCETQNTSSASSPGWEPYFTKDPAGDSSLPALVLRGSCPTQPHSCPATPVSPCLSVSCFNTTQTYHCGKMLSIPCETFSLDSPPSPKPAALCSCLSLPHLRPNSPAPKERLSPQGNESWKRGGQLWGGWSSSTLGPPQLCPSLSPTSWEASRSSGGGARVTKEDRPSPPYSSHILGSWPSLPDKSSGRIRHKKLRHSGLVLLP